MLLLLALFILSAPIQSPDPTLPPNATVLATAQAHGVQIYHCTKTNGTYQWTLVAPEAILFDPTTHEQVGTHAAGPSWTWKDGSSITGKLLQQFSSSEPDSIPWLLLAATPAPDHPGTLASISFVRRSDTHAGKAPATGCDQVNSTTTLRVPYAALYTFYGPSK